MDNIDIPDDSENDLWRCPRSFLKGDGWRSVDDAIFLLGLYSTLLVLGTLVLDLFVLWIAGDTDVLLLALIALCERELRKFLAGWKLYGELMNGAIEYWSNLSDGRDHRLG